MTEHCIRMLPDCDTVLGLVRRSGICDAEEFIGSLLPRYQARYQRYFERLRDHHSIKSPENLRRLGREQDVEIYELKVDKYRLYLVRHYETWYLTHGREKPKDNRVPTEIQKAVDIFWEWK
ncbi:hypothetical protein [Arthrobacter sp. 131MFCol6.1]|uniref:hypothetical protein n=1 Tax=Arthrobacter sp. 131MFCol6.1 TaxID=1157944 RepID=UPI0012DEEA9C|nr:hypothetical protein [Arthrobacter sp. 131MFCol6.1]